MILCDSNIFIYALKGDTNVLSFFEKNEISMSTISYLEVLTGAQKESMHYEDMKSFLEMFLDIPFAKTEAEELAKTVISQDIKLRKNPADLMIGATAVANKMPLCTNNPKDFSYFPTLEIISYDSL